MRLNRTIRLLGLVLALVGAMAVPASGAPASQSTSPVFTIPPPFPPGVVGSSTVVRADSGVSVRLETRGLVPGNAVTLWIIVANAPHECEAGFPGLSQCGPEDHIAGRGQMSVHHGAGNVVAGDGTVNYGAHLRRGDTSRALFEGEPGLLDPRGAEVIAVLKDHGPRISGMVSDQLRTFAGGCADQSTPPNLTARPELLGRAGDNECAEVQFTIHQAGQ